LLHLVDCWHGVMTCLSVCVFRREDSVDDLGSHPNTTRNAFVKKALAMIWFVGNRFVVEEVLAMYAALCKICGPPTLLRCAMRHAVSVSIEMC
jgi:hypothetical protein